MVQIVWESKNIDVRNCGRQFVLTPYPNKISDETKQLIDDLLLGKISLAVLQELLKYLKHGYKVM